MIAGRSLQGWLDRADELSAKGLFFEAHEELETGWREALGSEKLVLQGVIQLAAGLHRLRQAGSRRGAEYLLERGLAKLLGAEERLAHAPLKRLARSIAAIKGGHEAPRTLRFALRTRRVEDGD